MNKTQVSRTSWIISIVSVALLFTIFIVSLVIYHRDITIESEANLQRLKFEKIFSIESTIKDKFKNLTIPTPEQESELVKLINCKCHVSSIAVIYNDNYVYSSFTGITSIEVKNKIDGFALRSRNTLNDNPSIQYVFPVNDTTKIKLYLKPFEFMRAKEVGKPKIKFQSFDIDLYDGNEVLSDLDGDALEFELEHLDLLVDINYQKLIANMIKHHQIKMVLMLIILIAVSVLFQKIIQRHLLIRVIKHYKIKPYIQPIVDVNGNMIGGEILARWIDKNENIVSPLSFIPMLVNNKIIQLLTYSLMIQVNELVKNINISALRLSFNLTEECLFDKKVFSICQELTTHCSILLEFTETSQFSDPKVNNMMQKYRELGVKFAIDDYGTGNSGLSYLIEYQFDYIKIDKIFIDNICTDKKSKIVIECVCAMAEKFNLALVFEGVENESQRNALEQYPLIKYYQGYLFSKPLNSHDFFFIYLNNY